MDMDKFKEWEAHCIKFPGCIGCPIGYHNAKTKGESYVICLKQLEDSMGKVHGMNIVVDESMFEKGKRTFIGVKDAGELECWNTNKKPYWGDTHWIAPLDDDFSQEVFGELAVRGDHKGYNNYLWDITEFGAGEYSVWYSSAGEYVLWICEENSGTADERAFPVFNEDGRIEELSELPAEPNVSLWGVSLEDILQDTLITLQKRVNGEVSRRYENGDY